MADGENVTLKFIEDYRGLPILWDPLNKHYTNKTKRNDALQILATKYNVDNDGVKKKIKSLRSYFSKEHQKVLKKLKTDEQYQSSWFAYTNLLFTVDCVTPRETTEELKDSQIEVPGESSSTSLQRSTTPISEDDHEFSQPPTRKKRNIKTVYLDDKGEESIKFIKQPSELAQNYSNSLDEFSIYGQLVAHKIRKLNAYNQLIAQQRINNILFDLEMGQVGMAAPTENVSVRPKVEVMVDEDADWGSEC